jgi:hypothetical protein
VDAIVVETSAGERFFMLHGAETPYREMVETMSEGAVTVSADGVILYANQRFAFGAGQPGGDRPPVTRSAWPVPLRASRACTANPCLSPVLPDLAVRLAMAPAELVAAVRLLAAWARSSCSAAAADAVLPFRRPRGALAPLLFDDTGRESSPMPVRLTDIACRSGDAHRQHDRHRRGAEPAADRSGEIDPGSAKGVRAASRRSISSLKPPKYRCWTVVYAFESRNSA